MLLIRQQYPSTIDDTIPNLENIENRALRERIEDEALLKRISENAPMQTFTSVTVETIDHRFPGLNRGQSLRCRKITLQVTHMQSFSNSLIEFFKNILGEAHAEERELSDALIGEHLIGKDHDDSSQYCLGEAEIRAAFIQCKTVHLFLTTDCNHVQVILEDSKMYCVIKKAGQIFAYVLRASKSLGPIIVQECVRSYIKCHFQKR